MKEHENYPWIKMADGKVYYIPEPKRALEMGAVETEDTHEIFPVEGVHKNIQPMCLKLGERSYEPSLAMRELLPKMKLIPTLSDAIQLPFLKTGTDSEINGEK